MSLDRITQLRIEGLRAIESLSLDLGGLTVLIGDNGAGKSSILEALEILREAVGSGVNMLDVLNRHGGLRILLRQGASELKLGVTIEGNGPRLDYEVTVGHVGTSTQVITEQVSAHDAESKLSAVLVRSGREARVFYSATDQTMLERPIPNESQFRRETYELAINALGLSAPTALKRLIAVLQAIEIHVPFETRPTWQQAELGMNSGPRWPSPIESTTALRRYGMNLANAFHELRNIDGEVWDRVVERARMGLGEDLRGFSLPASTRGNIELEVIFGKTFDKPVPVEALSEGQLSYLVFLALVELHPSRSVLGFDEVEVHLHPTLLARVVWMLEEVAESAPVILSTHSDRLLDALSDPAASVVVCELDENRAVTLRRLNAERLAEWMESYRGFGSIRAEGYESHVIEELGDTKGAKP